MIRLTKIVCPISLTSCVTSLSCQKTLFSLISMLLTPSISILAADPVTESTTPLNSCGIWVCMMFCMLATKIRIRENPATNITGLKIISIMTENLRYLVIHPLLPFPQPRASLNISARISNGAPMMNIHRKTTLMMFAINSNANHKVYARIKENLSRKASVISVPVLIFSTLR